MLEYRPKMMIKHLPTAIANTLWEVFGTISIMDNEVLVLQLNATRNYIFFFASNLRVDTTEMVCEEISE